MQTAVLYLRYSSYSQNEQSIEGQRRVCMEYAEREGIKVVGEYIDRAKTAKFDDRPDFQKMIADSTRRVFDFIIVYKLDRFARNRRDAANNRYKLRMNGVKLLSAMENIGDNPESIILEAVLEAQAEYYSQDLSQKVRRGIKESVLKGNFLGGHTPYGFKVEGTVIDNNKVINKKLVIDEPRAAIVRQIFADYAAGKSKKQIIDELNARGVPSWSGKKITTNSFQHVLKSLKYIGKIEYGGEILDGYCPAIIDEETFYKVQARLVANKHYSAEQKAAVRYLLTRKVFCGHCGAKMVGVSGTSKTGAIHNYYACAKWYKSKNCDKKAERKSFLESYIVEQVIEYVLQPERLQLIAERVVAEYNREFNNGKLQEIETAIKKAERELDKLTDDYIAAEITALKKRIGERAAMVEAQRDDLIIERAKMLVSVKQPLTIDEVAAWLRLFTRGDPADPEFQERVIDTFINSVYLYDDKLLIYFNVKDSKQTCYIDHIADIDALNALISGSTGLNPSSYIKPPAPPIRKKTWIKSRSFLILVNGILPEGEPVFAI